MVVHVQAPRVQRVDLAGLSGVMIRQKAQVAEAVLSALGVPFEQPNGYSVLVLPDGKVQASNLIVDVGLGVGARGRERLATKTV